MTHSHGTHGAAMPVCVSQQGYFQVNCWNCEMGLENMGTIANLV